MNILLDYFFKITAIEPTPQASTAFLKQVLVVVKPKDGGVTKNTITLCTTKTAIDAFSTSASEADELFNAGMSRIYVVAMDDLLTLGDVLEGHESEFFTVLISRDFSDDELGALGSAAVKAEKKIQDILYQAKDAGDDGNSIAIIYADDGTGGEETVAVDGTTITVHMEAGVSTAQDIADAIEESVSASALVELTIDDGDEADVQQDQGSTSLEDGADAVISGTLDAGDFKGVIGVASDDEEFLETQAPIGNRVAFKTTTLNRGKNMFYAFGKMLSNASAWRNQQYIEMPVADDVGTLGDAENLFDEKISFVISDDEFGERLALFSAGGKAVVGPYIKRNLEIDMQSAALSYISGNQPAYNKKQAALLEDELQKVVQRYIDDEMIENGTVSVTIVNDDFVASCNINIAEPKALWRIEAEMRQTL